jgi:hypothetical protein
MMQVLMQQAEEVEVVQLMVVMEQMQVVVVPLLKVMMVETHTLLTVLVSIVVVEVVVQEHRVKTMMEVLVLMKETVVQV